MNKQIFYSPTFNYSSTWCDQIAFVARYAGYCVVVGLGGRWRARTPRERAILAIY
jgi:hypothetical protein